MTVSKSVRGIGKCHHRHQALLTLDASARYDGVSHSVRVRTGAFGDCYYLDLVDADWRAVEISSQGWRVSASRQFASPGRAGCWRCPSR